MSPPTNRDGAVHGARLDSHDEQLSSLRRKQEQNHDDVAGLRTDIALVRSDIAVILRRLDSSFPTLASLILMFATVLATAGMTYLVTHLPGGVVPTAHASQPH